MSTAPWLPERVLVDVAVDFHTFYQEHVQLGVDRRAELAAARDANLERLASGLEDLGPVRTGVATKWVRSFNQGSYAMHTLNQQPGGAYDLDTGLLFDAEALPDCAREARERIAEALRRKATGFKKAPRARNNAVTIEYAKGYHIDLAIYRRLADGTIEHSSGDSWNPCDPDAVLEWFRNKNATLSPAESPDQFRRTVRFVKVFAKSRRWPVPGGMILTVLVAETFRGHPSRDDIAFVETLQALAVRVSQRPDVKHPLDSTLLTKKQEHREQVAELRSRLNGMLGRLNVLEGHACTHDDARRVWRQFFNHRFWFTPTRQPGASFEAIDLSMSFSRGSAHINPTPYDGRTALLKGGTVWFESDLGKISTGERIFWIVENTGDEAANADDLGHSSWGQDRTTSRGTKYEGEHRMICEVRRGATVLARGCATVRVK